MGGVRQKFGLLGEKLSHSYSPQIHSMLGDYEYKLYEVSPLELDPFLRERDFDGINVTIPYKKTVIPYCGALSQAARETGCANVLLRRPDGSLFGHNTDVSGLMYLLEKTRYDFSARKTVVLGSGGASAAALAALRRLNARDVTVISRTGEDNYKNLERHRDAGWIINATPVGMYPETGVSPIPNLDAFESLAGVTDLIYNPYRTELLQRAKEAGACAQNGLAMLVAQAKESAEHFTDGRIPDPKIEEITLTIARQSLNVVLIGMPGCGKTSVGASIAEMTGRDFIDADELIVKRTGRTAERIILDDGEEVFRKLESGILREICKKSGTVIATGGGAVTRPENYRVIRQNGVVFHLRMDVSRLPVTGRPLSARAGAGVLAKERMPLYESWSDFEASNDGIEHTAKHICGVFMNAEINV